MRQREKQSVLWLPLVVLGIVLLILVYLLMAVLVVIYLSTFGRSIVRCFKDDPHTWKTEDAVIEETGKYDLLVMASITMMHMAEMLEHRVSKNSMEGVEHNARARVLQGNAPLAHLYYEYRWNRSGGSVSRLPRTIYGRLRHATA